MSKLFKPIEPAKVIWKDGLPYSPSFQDIYFSVEHGLEESLHVFIEGNRLRARFEAFGPADVNWPHFVIGECGFGTGLNVLLTLQCFQQYAQAGAQLHFFSAEKYPLKAEDLAKAIAMWPTLAVLGDVLLQHYPKIHTPGYHHCELKMSQDKKDTRRVFLTLLLGDAEEMFRQLLLTRDPTLEPLCRDWCVDAWFLDGFSPDKNQEMWAPSLLAQIALLSKPGATLATFSSAGWVRRAMMDVGFIVQKCKGYGRKRQMSVAFFPNPTAEANCFADSVLESSYTRPLSKLAATSLEKRLLEKTPATGKNRCTPWHVSPTVRPVEKKAIVLGAGLAGSFVAHELAKLSWEVTLIDEAPHEALQASNNPQAVLYPNLSIYRAPLTDLMLHAFTHALRVYEPWVREALVEGSLSGMMQLATTDKMKQYQASLKPWLEFYPALAQWVSAEEAVCLTGVASEACGLYLPCSGWINMKSLCAFLIRSPHIRCVFDAAVDAIHFDDGLWHVGEHRAPVLVVATGHRAATFKEMNYLSLLPFKGQMTAIRPTSWSAGLKIPLCAEGHITPSYEGVHWLGATYHQGQTDATSTVLDDEVNLARFEAFSAALKRPEVPEVVGHWSGIRASTRDHLPLVGRVPKPDEFLPRFQGLSTNKLRYIPSTGVFHEGLYLCAGFGSRGLTTVPWSAAYLAALIEKKPFACARDMAQSLSPARFLIQSMVSAR